MSNYYGYGVNLSKTTFKPNATKYLWEKAKDIDWIKEEYETYCDENELDPNTGFVEFVEEYQNDTTLNEGMEAFLADVLKIVNVAEQPFIYDDFCLVVPATVPINDAEKSSMLTQQEIREILAEFLNPILEEPITVEWLNICE